MPGAFSDAVVFNWGRATEDPNSTVAGGRSIVPMRDFEKSADLSVRAYVILEEDNGLHGYRYVMHELRSAGDSRRHVYEGRVSHHARREARDC